jgi:DNA-binding GntR family transcriptional regulator
MLAAPTFSFAGRMLKLDRTRQAAPQVFEQIREAIVTLELPPGTLLHRAELAQVFGVSQTPVRDALMRLGEEGLVDIYPQHATAVSRIDTDSALQVHFMRRAIEVEVAGTLASAGTDLLIAQLRDQLRKQSELAAAGDYAAFILADREFHRLMYVGAGVQEIFDLVRRMSGHVDRLRRLHLPKGGKVQGVVRDHRKIVDAIATRDADVARAAVREHLSGTLGEIDKLRSEYPDYVV